MTSAATATPAPRSAPGVARPQSVLAIIRQSMTPEQARVATLGMNAQELANLAWVLEHLAPEKRAAFVAETAGQGAGISAEIPAASVAAAAPAPAPDRANVDDAPGALDEDLEELILDLLERHGYSPRYSPEGHIIAAREDVARQEAELA